MTAFSLNQWCLIDYMRLLDINDYCWSLNSCFSSAIGEISHDIQIVPFYLQPNIHVNYKYKLCETGEYMCQTV